MSRTLAFALGSALPALALVGCGDSDGQTKLARQAAPLVSLDGEATACVPLYAGQHIDAGTVCVEVDSAADTSADCGEGATGALIVTYATAGDWQIDEAHLAVADSLDGIPTTRNGNPIPGQFPYNSGDISGATEHTFAVPLCTLGLDGAQESCDPVLAYVAAHAALRREGSGGVQTETGWADGTRFVEQGNWAEYTTVDLVCEVEPEDEPPADETCETAWAYTDDDHAFCATDIDGDGRNERRWGWYAELAPGSYSFDLYAGAGQCDLDKGTLVGTLGVEYDGATAEVTYQMGDGFGLDETHLYADAERQTTLAPGQLGHIHERLDGAAEDTYTVASDADPLFLSAHAVVCGAF